MRVRKDAVLRAINFARKELYGKRPLRRIPTGDTLSPGSCPLSRATGARVDSVSDVIPDYYYDPDFIRARNTLRRFIEDFDGELFPELIS